MDTKENRESEEAVEGTVVEVPARPAYIAYGVDERAFVIMERIKGVEAEKFNAVMTAAEMGAINAAGDYNEAIATQNAIIQNCDQRVEALALIREGIANGQ